jgi:hypothetical protein
MSIENNTMAHKMADVFRRRDEAQATLKKLYSAGGKLPSPAVRAAANELVGETIRADANTTAAALIADGKVKPYEAEQPFWAVTKNRSSQVVIRNRPYVLGGQGDGESSDGYNHTFHKVNGIALHTDGALTLYRHTRDTHEVSLGEPLTDSEIASLGQLGINGYRTEIAIKNWQDILASAIYSLYPSPALDLPLRK